jgi:hypothetical protein
LFNYCLFRNDNFIHERGIKKAIEPLAPEAPLLLYSHIIVGIRRPVNYKSPENAHEFCILFPTIAERNCC